MSRILVAVWGGERFHRYRLGQLPPIARMQLIEHDVREIDELAPRSVEAKELGHPRCCKDSHSRGADSLVSEQSQTEIVTDVSVGQEDSVDRVAVDSTLGRVSYVSKHEELPIQIGSGIDQEYFPGRWNNQCDTGDVSSGPWIASGRLATHAGARDVREATVLCGSEDSDKGSAACRCGDF